MSDWESSPPLSPPSASHDEAPSSDASAAAASRDDSPRLQVAAPPATVVALHGGSSPMSTAAGSDAAGASRELFFLPTSLKRLNVHIYTYLLRIGLTVHAELFLAEAEKIVQAGIPPVPFVQTWLRLDSKLTPSRAACDKQTAMLALNRGIMQYLDYLNINTDDFNEKAWKRPNHRVDLVEIWVDRIYPRLDLLKTGNDAQ